MSDQIPMRVAVVGATGFQGGAVARLLAERGQRVRTLTRAAEADRPRCAAPRSWAVTWPIPPMCGG